MAGGACGLGNANGPLAAARLRDPWAPSPGAAAARAPHAASHFREAQPGWPCKLPSTPYAARQSPAWTIRARVGRHRLHPFSHMAVYWRQAQRRLWHAIQGECTSLEGRPLELNLCRGRAPFPAPWRAPLVTMPCRNAMPPLPPSPGRLPAALRGGGDPPWARRLSNRPEAAVYTGPAAAVPKHVTLRTLRDKYAAGVPISLVTAYDYPSAVHVSWALQGGVGGGERRSLEHRPAGGRPGGRQPRAAAPTASALPPVPIVPPGTPRICISPQPPPSTPPDLLAHPP